ncbi:MULTISPECIES: Tox-REase-5 domain-containing protein [unclassified Janthinobacterium]|uniref:Tox-REase-5 domain-containing protein n=1 Tax=unclassified Janthinobacterium TaxID=2610881 RepID=UPI0025AFECF2|nr:MULTISPECIES: Tox-REase-5 domain-containing protein [unclassified Janthinobacterium]MDN2705659.1 Tox-REase-5 domain-containing protein [Janthinobacterium sp. SUN100]MDO8040357.1 Tox-REase-5 domain-containing protein [Janthinobacterium sp. SUN137]
MEKILLALGVAAAGAVITDEALRKRKKEAEEAKDARVTPIARAETRSEAKERCRCPPDKGTLMAVKHSMSPAARDYQARITGFLIGMEWLFEERDFDGFQSRLCLLQEAKADYDQFFKSNGEFKYDFQEQIFENMALKQAAAQSNIVKNNPPASLSWYFQTPLAYKHMRPQLTELGITTFYIP